VGDNPSSGPGQVPSTGSPSLRSGVAALGTPGQALNVELHLHTRSSFDSAMTPLAVIMASKRRHINCLAVTDHSRIKTAWEVQRLAPFPVIIGEEIRTAEGELIAYFLKEEIPRGLSPEESIERVRVQGGVVGVPHPFDRFRGGVLKRSALLRIAPLIDFVEAFNARNLLLSDSVLGELFARERGLRATAASDAHTPHEIGTSYLRLPMFKDGPSFLAALEQGEMVTRRSPPWVHIFSKWHTWRKRLFQ
jgi:predicted metal-dependent phosphoesterase TrpH